jgi:SAM-dependent methyltransferase
MDKRSLFAGLDAYFERTLAAHGPTPRGVDWNSDAAQTIRFEQLMKVVEDPSEPYSVLDYGCGYGALGPWLRERGDEFAYTGFDVSDRMLAVARRDDPAWRYVGDDAELDPVDYVVASGVFNLRLDVGDDDWWAYIDETVEKLARLARKGFAFNVLTAYSDPEKRRSELYYADPCRLFDLCKRRHGRNVALLHDYGLYEFTILVRP